MYCAFPARLLSGVWFLVWNSARSFLVHVSINFLETVFKDCSVRLPFVYSCTTGPVFTVIQVNSGVPLHWWTVNTKKIWNNDQIKINKRKQKYKSKCRSKNPNVKLLTTGYLSQAETKTALQLHLRNGKPTLRYSFTHSPPPILVDLAIPPK